VVDGKPADIVNFSVEPDVTRLVKADKVAKDWNADATKGIPFGSVVSLVVRKGNPKNIKDWDDLLQPGVEVVTPSPLSSGSAKWNLLAPYAAKSDGGQDAQAGLDFVTKLVTEHVKTRPGSGREATDVFLQGTGDVLISYENEAINVERQGKPVEHVNPPQTFKIENPVAVVTSSSHQDKATALKNFLFTPEGQKLWARPGSARWTRRWPRISPKDFPAPRSCGPSPTWVGGARWIRRCSTRRTARSPRSTSRPLDDIQSDRRRGRGWQSAALPSGLPGHPPRHHDAAGGRGDDLAVGDRPAAAGGDRLAVREGRLGGVLDGGHLARGTGVVPGDPDHLDRRDAGQRGVRAAGGLGADPRRLPGKRLVDAVIDLPFALPTIVASLVMLALYGPNSPVDLHLQHTRWGIGVALLFVTLPFVVRSVQPVLLELDRRSRRPRRRWAPTTPSSSPGSSCRRCCRPCCPAPAWRSPGRSASSARWC
jgi:ABC-type molybdate transport system substrate-binding protein